MMAQHSNFTVARWRSSWRLRGSLSNARVEDGWMLQVHLEMRDETDGSREIQIPLGYRHEMLWTILSVWEDCC